MNTKTLLGISIVAILTISVATVSVIPDAFATKPVASGQPDFIANFDSVHDPDNELNGQSFNAMFWVEGEDEDMKIAYKVILNKIDVGELGEDGNSGKGLTHFLQKLHVHPAPDGVHNKNIHHFNIVGPADDNDLKIAGNTLTGIWDIGDHQTLGNPNHESVPPYTVIEEICSEDTDINVHLQTPEPEESHLQLRGQLIPNTNFCDSLD